jgi:hypothetical protein
MTKGRIMPSAFPEPGQIVIARQRPFVVTRIETSTLPLPPALDKRRTAPASGRVVVRR